MTSALPCCSAEGTPAGASFFQPLEMEVAGHRSEGNIPMAFLGRDSALGIDLKLKIDVGKLNALLFQHDSEFDKELMRRTDMEATRIGEWVYNADHKPQRQVRPGARSGARFGDFA